MKRNSTEMWKSIFDAISDLMDIVESTANIAQILLEMSPLLRHNVALIISKHNWMVYST